jgi:hypothetical protein
VSLALICSLKLSFPAKGAPPLTGTAVSSVLFGSGPMTASSLRDSSSSIGRLTR